MPPRPKPRVPRAHTVYAFTTPARGGHNSTALVSTPSTRDSAAVHQEVQTQMGACPQDSPGEHQAEQTEISVKASPGHIDGPFDDNQQKALTAARRFLILGHLLKTVCRRISYRESSGIEPESIYDGALQQAMLSSQEKFQLMDASEMMLSAMEQLSQWPLIVEHDRCADEIGRPGLAERAEEDSEHICKFLANVPFEDGRLED